MIIKSKRWKEDDYIQARAKIWYIINKIQNKNDTRNILFEDIVWILSRLNYKLFKMYCIEAMSAELFNLIDFPMPLIRQNYVDISAFISTQFLSEAEIKIINNLAIRWKLYGKWCIRLNKLLKGQK